MGNEIKIKKKTIKKVSYFVIGIILLILLILYFLLEPKTTFSFYNSDTGESLNGELFFDNYSFGYLEGGNISVPSLDHIPSSLKLISDQDGEKFKVEYIFPEDYYSYSVVPFSLSQEDIDFYKKYYSHSKEDSFSNVLEPHFKEVPITWKLTDPSQCWKTEEEKIRKSFLEIEKASDGYLKFQEVYSNPDIIVNCYQDFTERYEELREEIEFFKTCENITFEGRKRSATNSELGLDDYTIIHSGGFIYRIDERKDYKVSSEIISINDTLTTWEVCKVNISDLSLNPHIVFGSDSNLNEYLIGEGGPSKSVGNIILESEARFFGDKNVIVSCTSGFPLPEVHELLHVLGFSHIVEEDELPKDTFGYPINDPKYTSDILYPYKRCLDQTKINEHYSSCLKYIYSNGEVGSCDNVNFMSE
ncbi:MAG: hypothetical protein WDZ62_02265 [Candidatus Pacearchaeota archaeon]